MSLTQLSQYTEANIIQDKAVNVEQGYVDDPNDSGGPTCWGITQVVAAKYHDYLVANYGWDGTMQNLSVAMATYIYQQEYWSVMGLDNILPIAPLVADKLFDAGINIGPLTVTPWLQQCLNLLNNQQSLYPDLKVDGNIGPATAQALQAMLKARPTDGMQNLIFMLTCKQGSYYMDTATKIAKDESFEDGWQNRDRTAYNNYANIMQ
jgi:lysozyme family protein